MALSFLLIFSPLFLGAWVLANLNVAFFILMVLVFAGCLIFASINFNEALFLFAFAIPLEQGFFLYAGGRFNGLSYLILVMVGIWVLRQGRTIRGGALSDTERIVLLWLLWEGLSMFWTRNTTVGMGLLWYNSGGFMILYAFSRGFSDMRKVMQCMWYYISGSVLMTLALLPIYQIGGAYVRVGQRYIPNAIGLGYGFSPHEISRTASIAMICALCLWQYESSGARRKLALGAALLFGLMVPLTLSRGTLLAQALAILTWVMLRGGKKRVSAQIQKLMLTLALVASVAGLVAYINRDAVMERVDQTRDEYSKGNEKAWTTGRSRMWNVAVDLIYEFPIFGVGTGSFGTLYSWRMGDIPRAAHNEYLKTGAELGITGLLLLCAWIFGYGWKAFRLRSLRHVAFAWWVVFVLVIFTHDLGRAKDFWFSLGFIATIAQLERNTAPRARTAAPAFPPKGRNSRA